MTHINPKVYYVCRNINCSIFIMWLSCFFIITTINDIFSQNILKFSFRDHAHLSAKWPSHTVIITVHKDLSSYWKIRTAQKLINHYCEKIIKSKAKMGSVAHETNRKQERTWKKKTFIERRNVFFVFAFIFSWIPCARVHIETCMRQANAATNIENECVVKQLQLQCGVVD